MRSGISTILVTGGSGFIASHIIKQLQQAGHRVRGTVRNINDTRKVKCLLELCPEARYPLELVDADLLKAESWYPAVLGCSHVIHTASPVSMKSTQDGSDITATAVEGTLSVLQACKEVGSIKRIVLTSSTAAINGGMDTRVGDAVFSEDNWTDPIKTQLPYVRSKTLAEREAWRFMANLPKGSDMEMAVINPAIVMGPMLCRNPTASMELLNRLMAQPVPLIPCMNIAVADVRDVATAHIVALNAAGATGRRHIVASHNIWLKEIAELLQMEFAPLGYFIPTLQVPYFAIKLWSLFDKKADLVVMNWGVTTKYQAKTMYSILGINPYPIKQTLIDMAYSMISHGFIKKTTEYKTKFSKKIPS